MLNQLHNLHVFLFKIIVVSIPDHVLQSQIRKNNLWNVRNCPVRKNLPIYGICIGNEILSPTTILHSIHNS